MKYLKGINYTQMKQNKLTDCYSKIFLQREQVLLYKGQGQ